MTNCLFAFLFIFFITFFCFVFFVFLLNFNMDMLHYIVFIVKLFSKFEDEKKFLNKIKIREKIRLDLKNTDIIDF